MPRKKKPHSKGSPTQKTKATFLYAPGRSILTARMRPLTWLLGQRSKYPILHGPKGKALRFAIKEEGEKGLRKPKQHAPPALSKGL